jgi:hypothetical protein
LERIADSDPSAFSTLKSFYESKLSAISDTLLRKIIRQLANLSLLNGKYLEEAITSFEEIIQYNPDSEEAMLAEIDTYTASLSGESGGLSKKSALAMEGITSTLKKKFGKEKDLGKIILPEKYNLLQNYPNPFNPTTNIRYELPKDGMVQLYIYDILGRKVAELVNEFKLAGVHNATFDASRLSSGVYFYHLISRDYSSIKKMSFVK